MGTAYCKGRDQNLASLLDSLLHNTNEFLHRFARASFPAIMIAEVYIGLGDTDNPFHWLHSAIDQKDLLPFFTCDPLFDPLRGDSRFLSL